STPRFTTWRAYSFILSGVRWAEHTSASYGTPNSWRMFAACCMMGQSDLLPITTLTRGESEEVMRGIGTCIHSGVNGVGTSEAAPARVPAGSAAHLVQFGRVRHCANPRCQRQPRPRGPAGDGGCSAFRA